MLKGIGDIMCRSGREESSCGIPGQMCEGARVDLGVTASKKSVFDRPGSPTGISVSSLKPFVATVH